ncbi:MULTISPECIES: CYTH and CHAD domain-containing protein [Pseudonocardia]|uniref:CYTH and CHAD domain-containing protein n=1 Tax=Pseudonocardia TaxID=1847 RepID=UPI001AD6CA86|nr:MULTISPECIES: CHAD domain-containing protein [Pseudonocardia]MBO4238983.1 CHAD domain-containing protein [Pseudonocardia alni]MCM3849521.1 CHAD domain-containing protein [Pseudonocardia sp. DR1-2]
MSTTDPALVPSALALTYRGPAHTGAPRLSGVDGVHEVVPVVAAEVREVERLDTADLRLFSAGIELVVEHVVPDRASVVAPGSAWVLRLPDAGPDDDLRVPLSGSEVEGVADRSVPDGIDALVRRVRGDAPLVPVGRVHVTRTVSRMRDDAGRDLATLTREQVDVATLGGSATVESWTEAVVEPGTAGTALLQQLDDALRTTGLVRAPRGGYARLTALLAEAAPVDPPRRTGRRGSAGALLLRYLGDQVDALAAREQDLRADRPDAVHQMRIAARRMRSALRTYAGLLEGPRAAHVVAELRWLGRALAGERDAEVQEERLNARLTALEPELLLGPVRAAVTRHFARTRAETGAAVLDVVDGERYAALQGALRRLLADPPLSRRARKPAITVLPAMVGRTARKLERRMERALADLDAGQVAPDSLHDARKTGKQLRYATEVARPSVGKDARAFAKRLKKVSDVLGEHQDAVVSRETLRTLGARAGAERDNGFTFGVLHGRDTATMLDLERRLPTVWETAWTRRARRWMRR